MSDEIRDALLRGGVIDITTTGRKTGEARRIEIRLHNIDGQLYLTGQPGPRSWHANLLATPEFMLHLKADVVADLNAFAMPVMDDLKKRRIHRVILDRIGRTEQLEDRLKSSPLLHISVEVPD